MTDVTPDSVYELVKSFEQNFTPPAPYVTIDVGTLDVDTATFAGYRTISTTDPEPVPHQHGQIPTNRPARYEGNWFLSTTIDATWHATTTRTPAPVAPLAPVLLTFAVSRPVPSGWTVTVNGATTAADASTTSLTVNIWDAAEAYWSLQAGGAAHTDRLFIHRVFHMLDASLGAFTIPLLPVSIVYAPPADAQGRTTASYTEGETSGSSTTFDSSTDTNTTTPMPWTSYGQAATMGAWFDGTKDIVNLSAQSAAGVVASINQQITLGAAGKTAAEIAALKAEKSALGALISNAGWFTGAIGELGTQLGQVSSSQETGETVDEQTQWTFTTTNADGTATSTTAGGPGEGDVFCFLEDLKVVWAIAGGVLQLCPLPGDHGLFQVRSYPVSYLRAHAAELGIDDSALAAMLALDPFAVGGRAAQPSPDRFTAVEAKSYGGGLSMSLSETITRDVKTTTTTTDYTITTDDWEAGPILRALGLGSKNQTTVKMSNAVSTDLSTTVSIAGTLAAGPSERFEVVIWFDNLFGTYAFQQLTPTTTPRYAGTGAAPMSVVTLEVGGLRHTTVADADGAYAFFTPNLPDGDGALTVGANASTQVHIGQDEPSTTPTHPKHPVHSTTDVPAVHHVSKS